MLYLRLFFFSLFMCLLQIGFAQPAKKTVIKLDNPTFTGIPKPGARYISGWTDCGRSRFPGESPPDLQPGHFLVNLEPKKGSAYLGMVARDNDTWESVTQLLSQPLKAGTCYNFSLHLAASEKYSSPARGSGIAAEEAAALGIKQDSTAHTDPIVLRIWGGKNQCEMDQLLAETDPIKNRDWKKFDFKFEPKSELKFIMLEAFYKYPNPFPQNGHILIDDLSEIIGVPCSMEPPLVNIVSPSKSSSTKNEKYLVKANLQNVYSKEDVSFSLNDKVFTDFKFDVVTGDLSANIPLRKGNNKLNIKASNSEGTDSANSIVKRVKEQEAEVAVVPIPKEEKVVITESKEDNNTLEGVKKDDLKKNQKLEIKNISFKMDSSDVEDAYKISLNKIATFLTANNDVVVEIGGHTNNRCDDEVCDRLSKARAKSVMSYLIEKGVRESQLRSKGYGRTEPIASNNSSYGRKKNQRVEIKILEIEG